MKNLLLKASLLAFLLLLLLGTEAATNGKSELYERTKKDLSKAVEKLNFKDAKISLYELVPLMKDDIKHTKKAIGVEKKAKNAAGLEDLKEKLNRKSEILEQLDHIMHSSPAALRVKASDAVLLVEEFGRLSSWPKTT